MTGKRIGYIRVSTEEQNPDRQLEGVLLDKKFIEYASARSTDRPQLQAMFEYVREDDTVLVHSMDRLARNLRDLRNLVDELVESGIQVYFVKENLTFCGKDNSMSNLMLSLMGAFAEFEYEFMKERQREGIAVAKKEGKFKGRKKKLNKEKIEILKEEMKTRKTKSEIARNLGISRKTLYTYIEQIGIQK
jgi:DNA invertase Pin-like site-specific DNA recombinase